MKKDNSGYIFVHYVLSALLTLMIIWLCCGQRAFAASSNIDSLLQGERYVPVLYNNETGLPTSEANAIAQTSEGFIWIGSYSGLIRYDGKTFERLNPDEGTASAVYLFVDSRDRLWVGTNDTGAAMIDHGNVVRWNISDGLKSSFVSVIAEDSQGKIYFATTQGVYTVDQDMNLRAIEDPRIANEYMEDLQAGSDGYIYAATSRGDIFTLKDEQIIRYVSREENTVEGITCLLTDPVVPGYMYFGTESGDIFYGSMGTGFRKLVFDGEESNPFSTILNMQYTGGSIWVCGGDGIGILDSSGIHVIEGLPLYNSVQHIMEDYEGNLWFTSNRQGVMKVVESQFEDIYAKYDLPEQVVNSTCISGDDLYVGTDSGLMALGKDGKQKEIPVNEVHTASGVMREAAELTEMTKGYRIRAVIKDSRERIWIATWRGIGLLLYDHGEVTEFTEEDGMFSDRTRAVYECRDGSVLVAATGGVNVIRDGKVTESYGRESGIVNAEILTVCEGPDGEIIAGSNGGGIYIIDRKSGDSRHIGVSEGMTSEIVMRIKKDTIHDVYWVVTSNSIEYLTPDWEIVTVEAFPYTNNFDLYENKDGDMWILSSNGIYVLPAEDMINNTDAEPVYYGLANGLPTIATANSYSELTKDGDLYIAGNNGIAKVNIDTPYNIVSDLKMSVPFIDADGERFYPDENGSFTIPSGVTKVTIYGCVFNYSLVNPLVTWQLEGYDWEPSTVIRSSLVPSEYTRLPGGTYRYTMQLHDSMSTENKSLSVQIVKQKAVYEHIWFYLLAGLILVLTVFGGVRLYVGEKIRSLEQKHKEETERQRIHTELDMASQIQAAMMPHTFPPFPDRPEFDIYATMEPAREVGGDFYDFFLIDDDHLCLVIADVSGKGIPAALFMMISKVILQSCAMLGRQTAEILNRTNEALCSSNEQEMFVTVWLGILEISTGKLTAANAGHEYPILTGEDGQFAVLRDKHGIIIGGIEGARYKQYEVQLRPGSKLFLYTDGLPEAMNTEENMFGMDRIIETLNRDPSASPEQILKRVRGAVGDFVKDAEQFDDLTMMCFEYKGK